MMELEIMELRDRLNSAMVILESISVKNKDTLVRLAKVEGAVTEKDNFERDLEQEVASDWVILTQMKIILGGFYRRVGLDQDKVSACRNSNKVFFLDEAINTWDDL